MLVSTYQNKKIYRHPRRRRKSPGMFLFCRSKPSLTPAYVLTECAACAHPTVDCSPLPPSGVKLFCVEIQVGIKENIHKTTVTKNAKKGGEGMLAKLSKMSMSFILVLCLLCGQMVYASASEVSDPDEWNTIQNRLKEYFLGLDTIDDGAKVDTCYVSKASEYLGMIQADGSFADVDYTSTTGAANGKAWDPYLALDRMQAIAIAYHKEGNELYGKAEVVEKLNTAIKHWGTANPRSTNWWENQIGVQLRFSRIALFMKDIMNEEAMNIMLTKLKEKTPVKYGTGQNNLWFDQNYVYHAIITEDAVQLKDMVTNYLDYCLLTQLDDTTAEAVQVDNSFYMHGRQFYSNGYGLSMFRDMSFWIYMLRETQFSLSQEVMDRMAGYMLNGTSWTIRGDIIELYLGYRPYNYDVGYNNYAYAYIDPLKRMVASDKEHAAQYQTVLDNIMNPSVSNGKNGHYYMWRSGYDSHMRDGYGVNIKMDSRNLIGGEWRGSWTGEDKGQLIYWTSSAASTITIDGDEYTNVYAAYDWAHCPGTTTPNRIVQDYSNYGRFTNGTDHTIGATDGTYGSTAYLMNKKGTQAAKGYFFFDDEFVALGAGIKSTETTAIHTTLNQSEADGVKVDGEAVDLGTDGKDFNARYIYNDKTGYVFLEDTAVKVSNKKQTDAPSLWPREKVEEAAPVFTAYIDHGVKPADASYAYIVVPNKGEADIKSYAENIPVTVIKNTADVQAVRHDGLKQTQINFYKAGSLEYKEGYTITVDQACSILIDESKAVRQITAAVNDQDAHKTINVDLSYDNKKTRTSFVSAALPYAGQSMTIAEGEDDRYHASSEKEGHGVKNVVDKNPNTYWESGQSQDRNEEWISLFTGTEQYINSMDILWGDHFASEYEIYTSQDGVQYEKIYSVSDGKGQKETVPVGTICQYVKILMKAGPQADYQIKEVTLQTSQLLSQNRKTETSSQSTQAPTFTGNLAVDGDLNTRWASLRNEDDNWISVDLGAKATIHAIEVNWESACSDQYQIEVSDNNTDWTVVREGLVTDQSLKDKFVLNEAAGRYVKLHSLKSRLTQYGINIFEFKVYGEYTDGEPEENVALNKPSSASSVFIDAKDGNKEYSSSLAFDGNTGSIGGKQSRWVSYRRKEHPDENVDDQWISVDLEDSYKISRIVLNWEGSGGKEYKVQISDNGEEWTDVSHVTDGKGGIVELSFDEETIARYVKMQGIEPGGQYGYSLWEFEVYGRLVNPPVDTAALSAAIEEIRSFRTDGYTSESIALYEAAITEALRVAESVLNKEDVTQEETDQAVENLQAAFESAKGSLVTIKEALQTELTQGIEEVQKDVKEESSYTPESWRVYQEALAAAEEALKGENLTKEEVDRVLSELQKAAEGLAEITPGPDTPVDKSDLSDKMEEIRNFSTDGYTSESIALYEAAITEALRAAESVLNKEDAAQEEIAQALESLQAAFESAKGSLVETKETLQTELTQGIEEVQKDVKEESNYTPESWRVYQEALAAAEEALKGENLTKEEVDRVLSELQKAAEGLAEITPGPGPDNPNPDKPDPGTQKPPVQQAVKKISLTLKGQNIKNKASLNVTFGKNYTFKANAVDQAGKKISGITWKSSNKKIATVKNGKVTIKKKSGKTKITASVGGKSVTVTLKASKKPVKVTKITIGKYSKTMKVKKTQKLKVTVMQPTAANSKVVWKSSNKKIATVNKSGKVTAKKAGRVTITATAKDGSRKKASAKITVKK